MRYDDWDVLLFPSGRDDRVPLREFKVNCHVVPDADFSHSRATFGLPVMTCFVPGLQSGAPFHISIHSWCRPKPSQHTLSYTKHPELATFEARIFIDGRMVASTLLQPFGAWPQLIASTSQMTKQGELEQLQFPSFRRELLFQNHWSPNDDLGRIKVLISEGFPRDSPSNPIERVKNVVAFAFQHAPLGILETNGIAWPNPQMWRRPQNNPALPVPTFYPDDGADSHLHSPRRRSLASQHMPTISTALTAPAGPAPSLDAATMGRSRLQKASTSTDSSFLDPFNEAAYQEWIDSLGLGQQQSHVDTPTTFFGADDAAPGRFTCNNPNPPISSELAHTLTHSLLHQPQPLPFLPQSVQPHQVQLPASEVKSRKENRQFNSPSPSVDAQIRKFSTANTTSFASPNETYAGVTKRSRNFTPASAKAIDEEDEPRRASPRPRVATIFPLNSDDNDTEN